MLTLHGELKYAHIALYLTKVLLDIAGTQKLYFLPFAWLFDAQFFVFCKYIAVLFCIIAIPILVYLSAFIAQNFAHGIYIAALTYIIVIPNAALLIAFIAQNTSVYNIYYNACIVLVFA